MHHTAADQFGGFHFHEEIMPKKGERNGIFVQCPICGSEFYLRQSQVSTRKTCGRTCFPKFRALQMTGENNHQYGLRGAERGNAFKDGTRIHNGYREILVGRNKYELEHRIVMSRHLERKLERYEHVHHINGDTLDNRIENLELLHRSEHSSHHRLEKPMPRDSVTGQFVKRNTTPD